MLKIDQGAAHVIAGDIRATFSAVDDAIVNGTRLFGSIVETTRQSDLSAVESQRLYDSVAAGLNAVVKGRGDIVDALKRMTVLKRNSNLEPVDLGCDNPLKTFTSASLPAEMQPRAFSN